MSVESRVEGSEEGEEVVKEVLYLSRDEVMRPWGWKCSVDNSKENYHPNQDSREKPEKCGRGYPHNRKESVGEFELVTVENWSEKSCSIVKNRPHLEMDPYRLHFKLVLPPSLRFSSRQKSTADCSRQFTLPTKTPCGLF